MGKNVFISELSDRLGSQIEDVKVLHSSGPAAGKLLLNYDWFVGTRQV